MPRVEKFDRLRHLSAGKRTGRIFGSALAASAFVTAAAPAAEQDRATLFGSCFVRVYDRAHLASHPGQRVAAISVQFQGFEDSLLAGLSYRLRYGPKFGVSGDCSRDIEGGLLCNACGATDSCQGNGETFKILWSGGDTIQLVNDTTGIVAENADGGRDRLKAGGAHRDFVLYRVAPEDCVW